MLIYLPSLFVNGQELEVVQNAKLLGVTITNNFSWNLHINETIKKASKRLKIFLRPGQTLATFHRNTFIATCYVRVCTTNLQILTVICCIHRHIHHMSRTPFLNLNFLDFDVYVVMRQFFEKRGYPVSVVKAGHHRAQQFDRQSSLQTSQKDKNDRIPFTLTFHPHNHAVKSIILNNFKLLQNDRETGRIFSQPPLISFKRDKNVGNFLVRSALKTNEQPGTSNARAYDAKLVFSL